MRAYLAFELTHVLGERHVGRPCADVVIAERIGHTQHVGRAVEGVVVQGPLAEVTRLRSRIDQSMGKTGGVDLVAQLDTAESQKDRVCDISIAGLTAPCYLDCRTTTTCRRCRRFFFNGSLCAVHADPLQDLKDGRVDATVGLMLIVFALKRDHRNRL